MMPPVPNTAPEQSAVRAHDRFHAATHGRAQVGRGDAEEVKETSKAETRSLNLA